MKTLFIAIIAICLTSCIGEADKKPFDKYLGGKYTLRKLSQQERKTPGSISGDYFLFWGSLSGNGESTERYVGFSWLSKDGEYIMSKVDAENIRIKFDNSATPYVTFGYTEMIALACDESSIQSKLSWLVSNNIDYMVIHCKESDYLQDINIKSINP